MKPRVLLATLVGAGKLYCLPFMKECIERVASVAAVYTVFDETPVAAGLDTLGEYEVLDGPPDGATWARWPSARPARARSAARAYFLRHKEFTHLYFHDSDMISPSDAVTCLLACDAPMASGIYNIRGYERVVLPASQDAISIGLPPAASSLRGFPRHSPGRYSSAHFGMGAMLLRRDVLRQTDFREPGWIVERHGSEDVQFCRDAGANGFAPVILDMSVSAWHVSESGIASRLVCGPEQFRVLWMDLSCGTVHNRFGQWRYGESRTDVSEADAALLGPGFVSDIYPELCLETASTEEAMSA